MQDKVVAYGKNQQNKSSARFTDQLHKDITLLAEIRQIETKLFDFCFSHAIWEKYSRVYLSMSLFSLPQDLFTDIVFVCKLVLSVISLVSVIEN